GPSGGEGGNGGDVILKVNPNMNTLMYFKRQSHFKAHPGKRGGSSNKTGANGDDYTVEVPPGTIVRDAETGILLADLVQPDEEVVIVKGGRGGKGNTSFKSSSNRAPRIAEKGAPGEERWITLELKIIADIGLVGVPNAGKSTLLSVVSNAKPKIANYPFTTLQPNLGMVVYDHKDMVFADIPGLIEGAHMGIGLGHAFLRHVQRTRLLIHVLDGTAIDPLADFNQINSELALYDEKLKDRPQIVVLNKMDLPEVAEQWDDIQEELRARGVEPMAISALTRQNIQPLIQRAFQMMSELPEEAPQLLEEVPLYELEEDPEKVFEITRDEEGNYVVTGKRIERAAAMTYWDYDEAILRFQQILEILGITSALRKEGVEPGDTVFIGEYELEWAD
ncbi:MAG: GTPase ObgE, partial [Aggregatilineales bacterium]